MLIFGNFSSTCGFLPLAKATEESMNVEAKIVDNVFLINEDHSFFKFIVYMMVFGLIRSLD